MSLSLTPAVKTAVVSAPFFIAESTFEGVKSSDLGEWIIVGAAVMMILNAGWSILDRVRGGSIEKREVHLASDFVTQQQHSRLEAEVAKIDQERRTSTAELHKKIEQLGGKLNERIDAIPERTIELLATVKTISKS